MGNENAFALKKIHPSTHPSLSPNLHEWAKTYVAFQKGEVRLHAYVLSNDGHHTSQTDSLFLGHFINDAFVGAGIGRILMKGKRAGIISMDEIAKDRFSLVPDFWENYAEKGRCHIDAEHKMFHVGDRFGISSDGLHYVCLWCKAKQRNTGAPKALSAPLDD